MSGKDFTQHPFRAVKSFGLSLNTNTPVAIKLGGLCAAATVIFAVGKWVGGQNELSGKVDHNSNIVSELTTKVDRLDGKVDDMALNLRELRYDLRTVKVVTPSTVASVSPDKNR